MIEPRLDPPEQEEVESCVCCGRGLYEGESARYFADYGWVCDECVKSAYKVVERN